MFRVFYNDDNHARHFTIAQTLQELKFILDRFEIVDYEPIV